MSKPNSFIESCGRRILLVVLSAVFLQAAGLSRVALSQENGEERDKILHQIIQNYIQVGTEQYGKGYFEEAEKTFLMAEGYQQNLTDAERQQLEGLLANTRTAIGERKRIVQTYRTVVELLAQDEMVKAGAHLDKIKDSKFLTRKEQEQIAEALTQIDAQLGGAEPAAEEELGEMGPRVSAEKKGTAEQKRITDLYNSSMKLYRAGELEKARQGFVKVMESGLVPPEMVKTLDGYVKRIDKTLAEKSSVEKVDRRKQLLELYKRSVELYDNGEFSKAREGFIKLVQSGRLTAAGQRNVKEYLQNIDNLLAEPFEGIIKPEFAPSRVGPQIAAPATGQEEGTYIEAVNRKRNIIRSHSRAVVNDAITKARSFMEKGEFDKAKEVAANAEVIVSTNQMHLGDELFKQYSDTLVSLRDQIVKAENETAQKGEEEKHKAAAEAQHKFKEQMEVDRQKRITELMKNARSYQKRENYEAALGQLESLLELDPQNREALVLKQTLEDMIDFNKQLDVQKEEDKHRANVLLEAEEAAIPYAEEFRLPKNWAEIVQRPTRRPDEPIGLDPADVAVYEQLDRIVDLSQLTPLMPLSEAIEVIKNAVQPPLRIGVLWRDLQENAQITPETQINMDGLPAVRLRAGLENLLNAVSGAFAELGFVVENGVITIATVGSLPSKLETRVYDVTDLLGQSANFMAMPGITSMYGGGGGMYGGGGGGGYGGGGYGGGGMSGYGGGTSGYGGGTSGYGGGGGGYGGGGYGGGGGGYGGGGYGGGGMGGYGGGGMGGYGGGGMSGYGGGGGGYGGGGMGGGMYGGGMGGGMYGGGGMDMGRPYRAQDMVMLIEDTIDPDTWYDVSTTGQGMITPYPSDQPKKLVVFQTRDVHKKIENLLKDMRRQLGYQVAIEARFLVVSESFLEDIGLDVDFLYTGLGGKWGELSFEQGSASLTQPEATKVPGSLGAISPAGLVSGGYGTILDDLQVAFIVRATQGRMDAKTMTAPKATVLSGETAGLSIENMTWYAIPASTVRTLIPSWPTGEENFSQITPPQQFMTGTYLTITPTIMPDKKNVLLNINATLSELLRMKQVNIATVINDTIQELPTLLPETETSQVMTRVSVPDGGTLLLGGQKMTAEIEKEMGVPVLSKIPIIGRAFSNRSKIRDQRILLILVKPTIILQEEREYEQVPATEAGL